MGTRSNVALVPMVWGLFKNEHGDCISLTWNENSQRVLMVDGINSMLEDELQYKPVGTTIKFLRHHGYKMQEKRKVTL